MSSAIVYGDSAPIGKEKLITRDTPVNPANCYGDSKVQAENGIRLARMNLCQLIGLPLHTPIDIEPDKDSDSFAVIDLHASITDRTEYQLLDMKTKLADARNGQHLRRSESPCFCVLSLFFVTHSKIPKPTFAPLC